MPRGKGGPREGAPGQAYQNRTDLNTAPNPGAASASAQPIRTPVGQPYGQAKAQQDAQRALPLPNAPALPAAPPAAPQPSSPGAPPSPGQLAMLPGQLGDFAGPTQRPLEPVTAGAPVGAGPGPEALGPASNPNLPLINQLRGLYMAYPTEDIRRLIAEAGG